MRKIIIMILFGLFVFTLNATVINIPADYSTIQAGINAASNGDTVLVQPGTYVENINYNGKNITVASLFLTTQDTSYISKTIIDGDSIGSVVKFSSGEDSTAVLIGFTIKNGQGGGSYPNYTGGGTSCINSSPSLQNLIIISNSSYVGGGICFNNSSPSLENVTITGNSGEYGGGIYCIESSLSLKNVTITSNNVDYMGGGIYCDSYSSLIFSTTDRCNIYSNTIERMRGCGADIFTFDCDPIDVIVDTFTVLIPTDYYASPIENFTFDILHSVLGNLINSDVYVSVDGDDSNTGTSADDPFRTIKHALSVIYSDSLNINTIHLAPGVYSDSTNGESFPIVWSNYVNLHGSGEDETILDAHNTSNVVDFYDVSVALIEEITIKNGNNFGYAGGGIYCVESSLSLENVTITCNSSYYGGGICFNNSSPSLENVTITGNSGEYGGGICCWFNSSPILENVTITCNSAVYMGGGIYCSMNSSPTLVNSIFSDNTGNYGIYNDSYAPGELIINYSDFWNNEGGDFYGVNDSIGVNITTNVNGDSCDAYYNMQLDPLFVNPANGDYHLSWLNYPAQDSTKSPCIDTGDPNSPLDPDSTRADMGAYYFDQSVAVDDPQGLSSYSLYLYPNPMMYTDNTINVCFSLKRNSTVTIKLFNIKGQLIETLINEEKNIGEYVVTKDVSKLSSGIYFMKFNIDRKTKAVNKFVLMK